MAFSAGDSGRVGYRARITLKALQLGQAAGTQCNARQLLRTPTTGAEGNLEHRDRIVCAFVCAKTTETGGAHQGISLVAAGFVLPLLR